MSENTAQDTSTNTTSVDSALLDTADDRANALFDKFTSERIASYKSESDDEPIAEEPVNDTKPQPANDPIAAVPPANDTAKKLQGQVPGDEDLDQRAKLERERVAWKREQAQRDRETAERAQKLEAREKNLAQLERRFEDPVEFLSYVEEKGWTENYIKHVAEMADPGKRAELAAKRAAQGTKSEVEQLRAELRQREQAEQARAATAQAESGFVGRVKEVTSEAPFTARLMSKAPEKLMARANAIAASFGGVAFNFDDVIIRLENELGEEARLFRDDEPQQPGSVSSTPSEVQQPKPDAAAKATTVSNRAASGRTGIVTEEAPLSFDDRIEAAQRRLRRMG